MSGQHLPPDYSLGDESTVGGYAAVHARPPALEGIDGAAYSVDVLADETGDPAAPWGAYLFFVRWRRGAPVLDGHVESDFLVRGATEPEVRAAVGALSLREAQRTLDTLIRAAGPRR